MSTGMQDINRPYLNYLLPLFQNEVWCSTIRMKLSLVYKWMKTSNHLKGLEPGLALKMRPMVIRKWPIRYYWCFPPRLPSSDGTCFTVNPRKHLSWLWLHLNFKKLLITALTCHSTPKLFKPVKNWRRGNSELLVIQIHLLKEVKAKR